MNSRVLGRLIVIFAVMAVATLVVMSRLGVRPESASPASEDMGTPSVSPVFPEKISLRAVGGYEGMGEATRKFDQGVFSHTVLASLDAPAVGKFYEGWLVMPSQNGVEPAFFSTGELTVESPGVYMLWFDDVRNYPEHMDVVVTEETKLNGLDGVPETHVLEGSF